MESLDDDAERAITIAAFRWLLCAVRPLSVTSFCAAVASTIYGDVSTTSRETEVSYVDNKRSEELLSVEHILHNTFNLVVQDTETHMFRFAHLSVREHLETLADYSDDTENHAVAALVCVNKLHGLAYAARHSSREHSDTWTADQWKTYSISLWADCRDTFLGYAITQWALHCQACPSQRQHQGRPLARAFRALFGLDGLNTDPPGTQ